MNNIKQFKKAIRDKHSILCDKYLRISKIKIVDARFEKNCKIGEVYRVRYKQGFNLWNPCLWILVLLLFIFYMCVYIHEGIRELIEVLHTNEYSGSVIIKK